MILYYVYYILYYVLRYCSPSSRRFQSAPDLRSHFAKMRMRCSVNSEHLVISRPVHLQSRQPRGERREELRPGRRGQTRSQTRQKICVLINRDWNKWISLIVWKLPGISIRAGWCNQMRGLQILICEICHFLPVIMTVSRHNSHW